MTKPQSTIEAGNINLLLLADILEDADERHMAAGEPTYDQTTWTHDCGTPACAIGHWLAHEGRPVPRPREDDFPRLRALFAVDELQWARLFGYRTGYERTARGEARLIREFVSQRGADNSSAEP